jgi:hypothetical protein
MSDVLDLKQLDPRKTSFEDIVDYAETIAEEQSYDMTRDTVQRLMQEHVRELAEIKGRVPKSNEMEDLGYYHQRLVKFWDSYNDLIRQSGMLPRNRAQLSDKFESYFLLESELERVPATRDLSHPFLNLSVGEFGEDKNFPSYSLFVYKASGRNPKMGTRPKMSNNIDEIYRNSLENMNEDLEAKFGKPASELTTKYRVDDSEV